MATFYDYRQDHAWHKLDLALVFIPQRWFVSRLAGADGSAQAEPKNKCAKEGDRKITP